MKSSMPDPGPWFTVSPDGEQIAYIGIKEGERYIAIVPVSDGELRIVHRVPFGGGPDVANTLEWSPDQVSVLCLGQYRPLPPQL